MQTFWTYRLLAFSTFAFGFAAAGIDAARGVPSHDCTRYQWKAERLFIGTYCTSAVDDKVKRQSVPGVGFGCLPAAFLVNSDHRDFLGSDDSVAAKELEGSGHDRLINAFGTNFRLNSYSSNIEYIEANGGDADVLNVVLHFNDNGKYSTPTQCKKHSSGGTDGVEQICTGSAIGDINTAAWYDCDMPVLSINDDYCGPVIQKPCT
jgi:hypothetical protein